MKAVRKRTWVLIFAAALILARVGVSIYDASAHPPPGKLFQVDGLEMHMSCMGGSASPDVVSPLVTVVLESGKGGWSQSWELIQPKLANKVRTCAYDRPGYGWSEQVYGDLSADAEYKRLHALLEQAGIDGEIILVAHSLGALYARSYASVYSDQVAGLVLIDPTHEDQVQRFPASHREEREFKAATLNRLLLATVGWYRWKYGEYFDVDPKIYQLTRPGYYLADLLEGLSWSETDSQLRNSSFPAGIPVRVISAENEEVPGSNEIRAEMHREISALSTDGRRVVAPGTSHSSFFFERDHARFVVDETLALHQLILDRVPRR